MFVHWSLKNLKKKQYQEKLSLFVMLFLEMCIEVSNRYLSWVAFPSAEIKGYEKLVY